MKKILLFLLVANSLWAQQTVNPNNNNDQDMKKYWFYRTKLTNDFMLVGTGQGMSLPFNRRAKDAPTIALQSATLEVGDELSTLGYYIGVLATEYALLVQNAQNTNKVKHELYCALNAVNRLDYNAESSLYGSCGPSLNGFLMRDDIPKYFVRDNYNHFNYNHPDGGYIDATDHHFFPNNSGNDDRGFASIATQGQWTEESNFSDYQAHSWNKSDLYMSQDHATNLLFGLSLARALVDPYATDGNNNFTAYESNYLNPGHTLKKEVENIVDRLVHYIGPQCNWQIKDPCTGINLSNYQGGNALTNAYAFAETGCINGTNQGSSTTACTGCVGAPTACSTYHDWYTQSGGYAAWQLLANAPATTVDNASIDAQLSAACNCIYSTVAGHIFSYIGQVLSSVWSWLGAVWNWVTTLIQEWIPITRTNNTEDGMESNVIAFDLQYAAFARRLIHNDNQIGVPPHSNPYHTAAFMNNLLDEAPCDGPWKASGIYEVYDWSSPTRIDHPEQRGSVTSISGEYNGIDYMLYHNIWRLYHNNYIGNNFKMIDLSDRIITNNFPLGNGLGSTGNPIEIDAFETVVMTGQVAANANVTIRAGKTIFLPGGTTGIHGIYHALPGKPFSCTPNSYVSNNFGARQAQGESPAGGTNTQPAGYNYSSTDMGIVATHHVDYSPEVVNYKPQPVKEVDNTAAIQSQLSQATPSYQQAMVNAVIKSSMEESELMILPNPNNGVFKVKLPSTNKSNILSVRVYDITGNLIATKENLKQWPDTEDIDVSENGAGTYVLRILTENGKNYVRKVIVK